MRILVTALLLLALLCPAVPAAPQDATTAAVDRYLREEMQRRRIPGLALAVVRDGRIFYTRGYGLANVELGVPVTPDTRFAIASLDKQLTATLVLMLREEGKLSLKDPLARFFPDAPVAWRDIRLRHVLSHTAGLSDDFVEHVNGRYFDSYSTQQLYAHARTLPLLFAPGADWSYSDLGYFLLCLVVERVAGKPYHDVLAERILRPLGMRSVVPLDPRSIVGNRASGYVLRDGQLYHNRRTTDWDLWNDLASSVTDWARWDIALATEKLLKRSVLEEMWTPATLADGRPARMGPGFAAYGFGWWTETFRGHRLVMHSGYTGVFILRAPEDRTSVIVFTNLDRPSGSLPSGLALGVAGFFLPEISWLAMKPAPDPHPSFTAALRQEIAGLQRGAPPLELFGSNFSGAVARSFVEQEQALLRLLGEFRSLAFLGREASAEGELRYYRADFAGGRYFVRLLVSPQGKIERYQSYRV